MSNEKDITIESIDFKRGPLKMFDPIPEPKVGDYVLVINDGGLFQKHRDRKIINGIMPYKINIDMSGKKLRVLSISEKLSTEGKTVDVIVLTDGDYSHWFTYEGKYKSYIKLL